MRSQFKKDNRKEVCKQHTLLSDVIVDTFKPKTPVPHVLTELNTTEHLRLVDNCIHLQDITICKTTGSILFRKVTYGKNVKRKKSFVTFKGSKIPSYQVDIHSMKRRILLITASKSDCSIVLPNLVTSSPRYNPDPSSVVVLLACIMKVPKDDEKKWTHDDFICLKRCKPNILQTSNHHNSTGYYASFGNKGSFDKATTSSVGQYTCKKKDNLLKQCIVNKDATKFEQCCANEISRSVTDLSTFLPNIRSILAPVLEVAFSIQELGGKVLNLKESQASTNGCYQSSICVNAETQEYHTEHDCTYTLISVPNQSKSKEETMRYDFLFDLTPKQVINIPLNAGVTFMFSGLFLKHRQNKSEEVSTKDNTFFNIASYGNKRLFYHIRKTLNRTK